MSWKRCTVMAGLECMSPPFLIFYSIIQLNTCISSYGCQNKLPRIWWPETADIYSFTALEAENRESRSWQSHALFADSREEPLLASSSFWCWRQYLACSRITSVSASSSLGPLPCVDLCVPSSS